MKIKVHIHTENEWNDKEVCIEMECDHFPNKGECIILSAEDSNSLEEQAKSSLEILERYNEWLYRKSGKLVKGGYPMKLEYGNDLSFSDAMYVIDRSICSDTNGKYISHIELGNMEE